jgi:hypothetical protein
MKSQTILSLVSALILSVPVAVAAEPKAKKPEAPAPAAAATGTSERKLPMYARVDALDAKGKAFIQKRKDGVEIRHVLSDSTEIKNGDAAAKFSDIKVGDWVSGLRYRTGENEYAVVKVTKIGPASEKKKQEAKAGE